MSSWSRSRPAVGVLLGRNAPRFLFGLHLRQLNEVAAGVVEDGYADRAGVDRFAAEGDPERAQPFIFGVDVVDLE